MGLSNKRQLPPLSHSATCVCTRGEQPRHFMLPLIQSALFSRATAQARDSAYLCPSQDRHQVSHSVRMITLRP